MSWSGIFLKFLARLFRAALIPYESQSNLECKKRVGWRHTTFTLCQNAACSSFFPFYFRVCSQFSGPDYLGAWNRLFLDLIKALVYKGTETSQIQVGPLRVQFRTRAISYFIPSIKMPTSMLYT